MNYGCYVIYSHQLSLQCMRQHSYDYVGLLYNIMLRLHPIAPYYPYDYV